MRLIYGEWGIDLEAPVYMSEEQRRKFIKFMQGLLPDIKVEKVREKEKPGPGGRPKPWTKDELELLLKTDDNETLARKLRRNEMSIRMRRAQLQPEFFGWANRNGHVIPVENKKRESLIRKFLAEAQK
jgi:hypothetical protein